MTLPLALLHGFTGSPSAWDGVTGRLPPGTRFEAPLLVGHGDPPVAPPGVTTFDDEVDRLAALLVAAGTGPFHLAGYSLGARLAIGLLVRHRALFGMATLIGAQPGLDEEAERARRRTADAELCRRLRTEGLRDFVDHWEALPLFESQQALPEAVRRARRAERLGHTAEGLARSLEVTGLGAMPPYREALSSLEVPTVVVAGQKDEKFVGVAAALVGAWPAARAVVVPGVGHDVVLEAPAAVAALLARESAP